MTCWGVYGVNWLSIARCDALIDTWQQGPRGTKGRGVLNVSYDEHEQTFRSSIVKNAGNAIHRLRRTNRLAFAFRTWIVMGDGLSRSQESFDSEVEFRPVPPIGVHANDRRVSFASPSIAAHCDVVHALSSACDRFLLQMLNV